jgi:hypothetical protein
MFSFPNSHFFKVLQLHVYDPLNGIASVKNFDGDEEVKLAVK